MSIELEFNIAQFQSTPVSRFNWLRAISAWSDEVGPLVRTSLQGDAPVRTSRLMRSIRYQRSISGSGDAHLEFTANVPYAKYVVHGTRAHLIRPKAARMLHWVDAHGSHFATIVHHPGTRPNNFPQRALDATKPFIIRRLVEAIDDSMR